MAAMNIVAHGVDIVDIARVGKMLEEHGERFQQRVFTAGELAYCDAVTHRRAERYAARMAAKEAVFKAVGTGWRDVEVKRQPSGRPTLVVTGACAQHAQQLGITHWLVSLSHAGDYAMASVIGCR